MAGMNDAEVQRDLKRLVDRPIGFLVAYAKHKILGMPKFTDDQPAWLRDRFGVNPYDVDDPAMFWFEREGLEA